MCGYECVDIFSRRLDESDINFIPQIFAREKKLIISFVSVWDRCKLRSWFIDDTDILKWIPSIDVGFFLISWPLHTGKRTNSIESVKYFFPLPGTHTWNAYRRFISKKRANT